MSVPSSFSQEAKEAEHQAREANETPAAIKLQQNALRSIFKRFMATPTVTPAAMPTNVFKSPLERTESLRPHRTDPPIPINASVPALRRTDFDGLVYEPGTTALMPTGLYRSPSVMPMKLSHCTGCGTESATLCNKCHK